MESIHGVPQLPDLNDFVLLPEKGAGGGKKEKRGERERRGGFGLK